MAAVLVMGPLYHLTARDDRLQALREARRVLTRPGILVAAAISRYASALDGLVRGLLRDPRSSRSGIATCGRAAPQRDQPPGLLHDRLLPSA